MTVSAPAYVQPTVLRWARESIGYPLDEAADKIGVSAEKLARAEEGEQQLTMRQAEAAAKVYERPLAALFISEPLTEEPQETQFRRLPGAPQPPWPPAMVALARRIRERQEAAADLHELLEDPAIWPQARTFLQVPPSEAAERVREILGIGFNEQSSWRDHAGYVPLRHWIDAVEELGVLVMHDGMLPVELMRGFASVDEVAPVIVVNAQDDPRARVFTVIHELGHLYLRLQSPHLDQEEELWLEQFAGEVLMPRAQLRETLRSLDQLSNLRKFDETALAFGVTPRAAVVRAVRAELIPQGEATEVLEQISARPHRESGGGGNYYRTQIARLSPSYSRLVFSALESQAVTYAAASSLLGGMKVNNFEKFRGYLEQRAEME